MPWCASAASEPSGWPLEVIAVGPAEHSLELLTAFTDCGAQGGVVVHESSASVEVERSTEARSSVCDLLVRSGWLVLPLARPLAGRAILGQSLMRPGSRPLSRLGLLHGVPRLIGFAPADARHALAVVGLSDRIRVLLPVHGRRRVVSQDPAPGAHATPGMSVQLTVGGA
jgi:hypothetical protein